MPPELPNYLDWREQLSASPHPSPAVLRSLGISWQELFIPVGENLFPPGAICPRLFKCKMAQALPPSWGHCNLFFFFPSSALGIPCCSRHIYGVHVPGTSQK